MAIIYVVCSLLGAICFISIGMGIYRYFTYEPTDLCKDTRYKRKEWSKLPSMLMECGGDEKKPEPNKPLTREEKEALAKKEKESRTPGALLKRAQKKASDYCEDEAYQLLRTDVFYGKDLDGRPDVRAFFEYGNGELGFYYANGDPNLDSWVVLSKDCVKELEDIMKRQGSR